MKTMEDVKNWLEKQKLEVKLMRDRAVVWCSEHKTWLTVFGPPIIAGFVEITKAMMKRGNLTEEKRLKQNYIYDRSSGHYYEVRRKLKSSEWLQIDQRKMMGEPLGMILQDMRLLK